MIDGGFGSAVRMVCSQRQGQLKVAEQDGIEKDRVSISSCEDFDWSLEDASPFLLNLKELSLGNVSPEAATMVAYLRSNVVSPVEVEMDIEQATAGARTSMSTLARVFTHTVHVYNTHGSVWPHLMHYCSHYT